MYRKEIRQEEFKDFDLPFAGKLDPNNRWVRLAEIVPWEEAEDIYAEKFRSEKGPPARNVRMALGTLIIKEKLGLTDDETVEQVRENPYLQYFIGLRSYQNKCPFDQSTITHFRKRLDLKGLSQMNEKVYEYRRRIDNQDDGGDSSEDPGIGEGEPKNMGKMVVDATCAPADIAYPTDLKLLGDAREKTEEIIDQMHEPMVGRRRKPRTYREKARKEYLKAAKRKKMSRRQLRKAIGKQLSFVRRNLRHIDRLLDSGEASLEHLDRQSYRKLLVVRELYRQQDEMHSNRSRSVADRIVSISQPHVRPIVRGKARASTEFGAKVSISLVDGYAFVDRIGWDSYNESGDLIGQIESYRGRHGHYPESVHADKIYRNRKNLRYCSERGIRLSGPPLGRPPSDKDLRREQRKQAYEDELVRNAVEGKFGQGKRRYGLGLIMNKLSGTSETAIMMSFLVMNLDEALKRALLLLRFLARCFIGRSMLWKPQGRGRMLALVFEIIQ